jgi:NADH:ubiquinone oxidoreductase subunit D
MADGIPEYLQTATHVKTRKPRKRVLKRSAVDEGETPVTVPEAPTNATTITKPVTVPETVTNTITKPQVSAPVTPVVSALVEAPHGITVVDATLDELKEAMRKKIWTPSYDTFFGVDIVAKNKAASRLI